MKTQWRYVFPPNFPWYVPVTVFSSRDGIFQTYQKMLSLATDLRWNQIWTNICLSSWRYFWKTWRYFVFQRSQKSSLPSVKTILSKSRNLKVFLKYCRVRWRYFKNFSWQTFSLVFFHNRNQKYCRWRYFTGAVTAKNCCREDLGRGGPPLPPRPPGRGDGTRKNCKEKF